MTRRQLDAYLAGFAYALGRRIDPSCKTPQPLLVPVSSFAPLYNMERGADLQYLQQDAEVRLQQYS